MVCSDTVLSRACAWPAAASIQGAPTPGGCMVGLSVCLPGEGIKKTHHPTCDSFSYYFMLYF